MALSIKTSRVNDIKTQFTSNYFSEMVEKF